MEDVIILGIGGVLVALALTIFTLLWYSGVFTSIDVGTGKPPFGKLKLAYKFGTGPYKDCGPLFTELQQLAPDINKCGIYYDDPKTVDNSLLRYIVAGVVSEGDIQIDEDTEKKLLDNGYKTFSIPRVDFVVHSTFPYIWDLSFYIAIMKVYPRLDQYITERQLTAYPAVEFHTPTTIHFVMPLSKQEAFYVPEAAEMAEPVDNSEIETKSDDEERYKETQEDDDKLAKSAPSGEERTKEESGEDSSSSFEQVEAPK